jgi:hypothetical protein
LGAGRCPQAGDFQSAAEIAAGNASANVGEDGFERSDASDA